ncbi:hypothetical protein ACTXT7_013763 [Hymenolepis weldensis]
MALLSLAWIGPSSLVLFESHIFTIQKVLNGLSPQIAALFSFAWIVSFGSQVFVCAQLLASLHVQFWDYLRRSEVPEIVLDFLVGTALYRIMLLKLSAIGGALKAVSKVNSRPTSSVNPGQQKGELLIKEAP